MDRKITGPLAATIAAATLIGGLAAPAWGEGTDNGGGDTGSGETKPPEKPAYSQADLKGVKAFWHTSADDKAGAAIDGFDPTKPAAGPIEVPNGAYDVTLGTLPTGPDGKQWTATRDASDPWVWTIHSPDQTIAATYTFKRRDADKAKVTAFNDAWAEASRLASAKDGEDAWGPSAFAALKSAVDAARGAAADPAGQRETQLDALTGQLSRAVSNLRIINWSFAGQRLTWSEKSNAWTLNDQYRGNPAGKTLKIEGGPSIARQSVDLKATQTGQTQPKLNVYTHTGVLTGSFGGEDMRIGYTYTDGVETTLADGTPFAADGDVWRANGPAGKLDKANRPDFDEVALSDGTRAPVTWDTPTLAKDDAQARIWTARGVASATLKGGQRVEIAVTATRAWDPAVTIALERRPSDGNGQTIDVADLPDASASGDDLAFDLKALPYTRLGDQYTVKSTTGADVTVTPDKPSLGDDGTRVFTGRIAVTLEDGGRMERSYRIVQPFEKPARDASDPEAALDSIEVNGRTIEGWDPDVLEYTITAGEDDKVTVSPKARDGQTVKASDATLTAYTTVQHWTVTKDGQSRVYTVTLVRDHDTPTADEAFTPKDPTDLGGKEDAPSKDTTDLKSVGYRLSGRYVPMNGDSFVIPEGGEFAYETYAGQVARVQSGRDHGMTWKYEIGVLAPDQATYAGHTYTVVYTTAATARAALTGILADGRPVDGFDPATLEYTVEVNDPQRYVVTPEWDKPTGMSVTKHVSGADTTLTVVSADGRRTVVYKVHAVARPFNDTLADTGATVGIAAAGLAVLAAVGALLAWVGRRGRRNADMADGPAPAPTLDGVAEPHADYPASEGRSDAAM